jgi:hypothetical protein
LATALALALPFAGSALSHDGTISTVAGTGTPGNSGDLGPADLAQLQGPRDVAPLDGGGFLVADTANHVVRKVDSLGVITRVAGTGVNGYSGDGGLATLADIGDVPSVSPTSDGGFLIADPDAHRVRKVSELGIIDTVAGSGVNTYDGDGVQATLAGLDKPTDAVELPDGSILIADSANHRIRKVSPAGVIDTVAGTGTGGFSGDGGPATSAGIKDPLDISPLGDGGFLFVDAGNRRIRQVDADGTISTVAGTNVAGPLGDGGPATAAYLDSPVGVTALADGGFLIADQDDNRVRRVDPDGTITTDAGTGTAGSAGDGGMPDSAELAAPADVSVSPEAGYFIADSGNDKIRFVWTYDLPAGTDITPPGKPEIERGPGKLGNDPRPRWKFTAEDGAETECKLKRGSTVVFGWAECTSPRRYQIGDEPDGLYTFHVRATDAAGNTGPAATDHYELDQTAPAAPLIDAAPEARGADLTPSFGFSGEEGATFRCELTRDEVTIFEGSGCTSPMTYDLVAHGAGSYGFAVRAVDAAGNKSAPAHAAYVLELKALQLPDAPEPVLGKTVVAAPAKGTALMKLPGSRRWVELGAATGLPVGTRIDARRGVARLSSALDSAGRTQSARFAGGIFEVRQRRRGRGLTDIILRGRPAACPGTGTNARPAATAAARRGRRLWARDNGGRWRTHGQNSVATVRGTKWLTADRCGGTLTRVLEGAVVVRNRRTGRRVLVRTGDYHIARARRR